MAPQTAPLSVSPSIHDRVMDSYAQDVTSQEALGRAESSQTVVLARCGHATLSAAVLAGAVVLLLTASLECRCVWLKVNGYVWIATASCTLLYYLFAAPDIVKGDKQTERPYQALPAADIRSPCSSAPCAAPKARGPVLTAQQASGRDEQQAADWLATSSPEPSASSSSLGGATTFLQPEEWSVAEANSLLTPAQDEMKNSRENSSSSSKQPPLQSSSSSAEANRKKWHKYMAGSMSTSCLSAASDADESSKNQTTPRTMIRTAAQRNRTMEGDAPSQAPRAPVLQAESAHGASPPAALEETFSAAESPLAKPAEAGSSCVPLLAIGTLLALCGLAGLCWGTLAQASRAGSGVLDASRSLFLGGRSAQPSCVVACSTSWQRPEVTCGHDGVLQTCDGAPLQLGSSRVQQCLADAGCAFWATRWGTCSNSCGEGVQFRALKCNGDMPETCSNESARPRRTRGCVDMSGCRSLQMSQSACSCTAGSPVTTFAASLDAASGWILSIAFMVELLNRAGVSPESAFERVHSAPGAILACLASASASWVLRPGKAARADEQVVGADQAALWLAVCALWAGCLLLLWALSRAQQKRLALKAVLSCACFCCQAFVMASTSAFNGGVEALSAAW